MIRLPALDRPEAGLLPRPDGTRVGRIGIDSEATPSPGTQEPAGESARGVRAEAATPRSGEEKHVQAALVGGIIVEPGLKIPDRHPILLNYIRINVGPRQSDEHLLTCEGFPIPVPGHVGIGVPADEEIDIILSGPADDGELAAERSVGDAHDPTLRGEGYRRVPRPSNKKGPFG